jgi:hypothetical protein
MSTADSVEVIREIFVNITTSRSQDRSVGIATGYELNNRGTGVQLLAGQNTFLFSTASKPALRPIQPHV